MITTDNVILEYLCTIRASLDALHTKADELANRMGGVEQGLAHLYTGGAEQSVRIDRLSSRVERIEKRLELVS